MKKTPSNSSLNTVGTSTGMFRWIYASIVGQMLCATILVLASGRGHPSPGMIVLALASGLLGTLALLPWSNMMARQKELRQLDRLIVMLRGFRTPLDRETIDTLRSLPPGPLDRLAGEMHDVLSKMISMGIESRALQREFGRQVRARTRLATVQLRQEALTDPLTGLGNRRALETELQQLFDEGGRLMRRTTVMALDLDRLKLVNDELGHTTGDECLAFLGQILQSSLRGEDLAFRTGGDEFIVLMHDTDVHQATHVARRLAQFFSQFPWPHDLEKPTLSIGLAQQNAGAVINGSVLLRLADQMLYVSKHSGGDCIEHTGPGARAA